MIPYMFFSFQRTEPTALNALTESRKFNQEILGVELENTGSQKERIKEARYGENG